MLGGLGLCCSPAPCGVFSPHSIPVLSRLVCSSLRGVVVAGSVSGASRLVEGICAGQFWGIVVVFPKGGLQGSSGMGLGLDGEGARDGVCVLPGEPLPSRGPRHPAPELKFAEDQLQPQLWAAASRSRAAPSASAQRFPCYRQRPTCLQPAGSLTLAAAGGFP